MLLGAAGYRHHGAPALKDTIGVLQLVFATVAGAGALVALIVAYRRQKITEADSVHDRTRVFNERFTTITPQLGDDKAAVSVDAATTCDFHGTTYAVDDHWDYGDGCNSCYCFPAEPAGASPRWGCTAIACPVDAGAADAS